MKTIPALILSAAITAGGASAQTVLTRTLSEELDRNFNILKQKPDAPAYFMSYEVTDIESDTIVAAHGSVDSQNHNRIRLLDTTVHVGTPQFDNYKKIVNVRPPKFTAGSAFTLEDNPGVIRQLAWQQTDGVYKAAAQRLTRIKSDLRYRVDESDHSGDFSIAQRHTNFTPRPTNTFRPTDWSAKLRNASADFAKYPSALGAMVRLQNELTHKTIVNTEGTQVEYPQQWTRIAISAQAKAPDGMDLAAFESFDANDPTGLPAEAQIRAAVNRVGSSLEALVKAPAADPFVGPAILSGRSAGVFFHEIFGHRIEGHRMKDELEGQTFRNSMNTKILPDFLNVTFDPNLDRWEGQMLNGYYKFDDEGTPAKRVPVVQKGTLTSFLTSRTPINGFPESNGHGRRAPGNEIVSRQSNLIVESTNQVNDKQLRQMLIEEIKRQNKPYGLFFETVTGGYAQTQTGLAQTFNVVPLVVYRVFADGRPDELIRGVEIVGTPLASLAKILATGDKTQVFNGYCGAESGDLPVSAVSPSILVSEIEVQRRARPLDRGPYLPSPDSEFRIDKEGK